MESDNETKRITELTIFIDKTPCFPLGRSVHWRHSHYRGISRVGAISWDRAFQVSVQLRKAKNSTARVHYWGNNISSHGYCMRARYSWNCRTVACNIISVPVLSITRKKSAVDSRSHQRDKDIPSDGPLSKNEAFPMSVQLLRWAFQFLVRDRDWNY